MLLDLSLKSAALHVGENVKSCQPTPYRVTSPNKARWFNGLQSFRGVFERLLSQPMVNVCHPVIEILLFRF